MPPSGKSYDGVDPAALAEAVAAQSRRTTPGITDMAACLAAQVKDTSCRDVKGPLKPGGGVSGLVVRDGEVLASWGDPDAVEMCFSVTKSVVSTVAGLAYDRGLLPDLDEPVADRLDHPAFTDEPSARGLTWRHLLQ